MTQQATMGMRAEDPDGMAWASTLCLMVTLSCGRSAMGRQVLRAEERWCVSFKPASSRDLYRGLETAPLCRSIYFSAGNCRLLMDPLKIQICIKLQGEIEISCKGIGEIEYIMHQTVQKPKPISALFLRPVMSAGWINP